MIVNNKKIHLKILYNFFIFLSAIIFFFSTNKVMGKAFNVNDIDISRPFEINFNKNEVIDDGFKKAFFQLTSLILNSTDQQKFSKIRLNEIKGMIESFSIKEEKFINEIYHLSLSVSFNKKKVFKFLERKSIFPSIPIKNKFLFIPIVVDEKERDLLVFNNNKIFNKWNDDKKKTELIEYILPTEDLEDINLIKKNYDNIEQYNFKEITDKYYLDDSIISLIFKNETEVRVLSRITVNEKVIIKNQSFSNLDLNDEAEVKNIINNLKIIYEDYWKNYNKINTSIKLSLNIKLNTLNNSKISNFEKILNKGDLIYDFTIYKFNKDFIYYEVIFNGTPDFFLKTMKDNDFNFDTQNKIWILK